VLRRICTSRVSTEDINNCVKGRAGKARRRQPAELASIDVQLAASDASFATGQIYGSSGGAGQP